jgi:hypothetical protein
VTVHLSTDSYLKSSKTSFDSVNLNLKKFQRIRSPGGLDQATQPECSVDSIQANRSGVPHASLGVSPIKRSRTLLQTGSCYFVVMLLAMLIYLRKGSCTLDATVWLRTDGGSKKNAEFYATYRLYVFLSRK